MRPKSDIQRILRVTRVLPSIHLFPRIRESESIFIITSPYSVSESVSESASESDAESASTTSANVSASSSSSLSSSLLWSKRHEPGLRALKNVGWFARSHAFAFVVRDEDQSCAVGS